MSPMMNVLLAKILKSVPKDVQTEVLDFQKKINEMKDHSQTSERLEKIRQRAIHKDILLTPAPFPEL
jgi:hypothetical protein